jgi:hypothetical protein
MGEKFLSPFSLKNGEPRGSRASRLVNTETKLILFVRKLTDKVPGVRVVWFTTLLPPFFEIVI